MSTDKDLSRALAKELGPLTFGSFLRGARVSRDMTQAEMARFLEISRSTLCDIEKGRQLVSPALAARIAGRCGLSKVVAVEAALMDQIRRARLKMLVQVTAAAVAATGRRKEGLIAAPTVPRA